MNGDLALMMLVMIAWSILFAIVYRRNGRD